MEMHSNQRTNFCTKSQHQIILFRPLIKEKKPLNSSRFLAVIKKLIQYDLFASSVDHNLYLGSLVVSDTQSIRD